MPMVMVSGLPTEPMCHELGKPFSFDRSTSVKARAAPVAPIMTSEIKESMRIIFAVFAIVL